MPAAAHLRLGAAVAAGVLALGVLGGCAVRPEEPAPSTAGVVVSPVQPSGTATQAVSLPPAAPLPAASKWVTTAGHGVKFAVPETWAMFDLTTFNSPEVRAALEPIAQRLGKSVDAYIQDLATMNDLIVTGPEASGYTSSISVRKEAAQAVGDTPTVAQAQADVAPLNGTVTSTAPILTSLGAGYQVFYTRPADAGTATLYCAVLGLPSAKNTAFVLVAESDTQAQRDALIKTVVETFQPS